MVNRGHCRVQPGVVEPVRSMSNGRDEVDWPSLCVNREAVCPAEAARWAARGRQSLEPIAAGTEWNRCCRSVSTIEISTPKKEKKKKMFSISFQTMEFSRERDKNGQRGGETIRRPSSDSLTGLYPATADPECVLGVGSPCLPASLPHQEKENSTTSGWRRGGLARGIGNRCSLHVSAILAAADTVVPLSLPARSLL